MMAIRSLASYNRIESSVVDEPTIPNDAVSTSWSDRKTSAPVIWLMVVVVSMALPLDCDSDACSLRFLQLNLDDDVDASVGEHDERMSGSKSSWTRSHRFF